jgi:protein arginine kinase
VKISSLIETSADWLTDGSEETSIVISSRIRLARNIQGYAFPTWAKKAERLELVEKIKPVVEKTQAMSSLALSESMDCFTQLDKQILVEQHMISREHAAKSAGSAVVINKDRTISIMINEEDHLRMQSFQPGLRLREAWQALDTFDSELEKKLPYAFHDKLGYLTACPTNVGTGMRASAMLHLPALVLDEQINQVVQAVGKLSLAVRGLYGEGTEALGNLFQISNQTTLGEVEEEIVERLTKVIQQLVTHEQNARASLLEKKPRMLADQVCRAYGILTNAHALTSKEALNLLSILRMGVDLGILPYTLRITVDELMIATQPAHLQVGWKTKLTTEERDGLRADLVRKKLSGVKKPDTKKILKPLTIEKESNPS